MFTANTENKREPTKRSSLGVFVVCAVFGIASIATHFGGVVSIENSVTSLTSTPTALAFGGGGNGGNGGGPGGPGGAGGPGGDPGGAGDGGFGSGGNGGNANSNGGFGSGGNGGNANSGGSSSSPTGGGGGGTNTTPPSSSNPPSNNQPPSGPSAPTCTLSASATSITKGNTTTISWSSTDANTVTIDQGVGTVSASGSQSVSPNTTTTYTATVTNSADTATCQASVTVSPGGGGNGGGGNGGNGGGGGGVPNTPDVSISSLAQPGEQPLASVRLSQIPYTGISMSPGVFYTLLAVWSAVLTGFLLYTRWGRMVLRAPVLLVRTIRMPLFSASTEQFVSVGTQSHASPQPHTAPADGVVSNAQPADVLEDAAQERGAMIERAAAQDILTRTAGDVTDAQRLLTRIIDALHSQAPSEAWTLVTQARVAEVCDTDRAADATQTATEARTAPLADASDTDTFITAVLAGDTQAACTILNTCTDASQFMRAAIGTLDARIKAGDNTEREEAAIAACIEALEGHYASTHVAAKAAVIRIADMYENGEAANNAHMTSPYRAADLNA